MPDAGRDPDNPPTRRSAARFAPLDGRRVVIADPAALKALYDPLRFEIVRLLGAPRSVKEIAAQLGRKPSGLYHHVRLLEDKGLVRVAEERAVGRRLERLYVRVASEFETADELSEIFAGLVEDKAFGSVVEHLRRAFQSEGDGPRRPARFVADYRTVLTPEEAHSLAETIPAFMDEQVASTHGPRTGQRPSDGVEYRVVISMAPVDDDGETEVNRPESPAD